MSKKQIRDEVYRVYEELCREVRVAPLVRSAFDKRMKQRLPGNTISEAELKAAMLSLVRE